MALIEPSAMMDVTIRTLLGGQTHIEADATTPRDHSCAEICGADEDSFERKALLWSAGTDDPEATSKFSHFNASDDDVEILQFVAHPSDFSTQPEDHDAMMTDESRFDAAEDVLFVRIDREAEEAIEVTAEEVREHFGVDTSDDEDHDNDEQEILTDGGQNTNEVFDDAELEESIDSNGALTDVDEVRSALESVQESFEGFWGGHMDAIEDNALELVAMDGDVLVFADHTGQFWNEEFLHAPLAEIDDAARMKSVVSQLHHNWARRHTDYSWKVDDPVVVRAPDSFDAGQRLVESVMINLTARGLTPREAWCVWGVLAGNSRNNWAARMGYDSHSGVSNAVRDAKGKVPLPYIN